MKKFRNKKQKGKGMLMEGPIDIENHMLLVSQKDKEKHKQDLSNRKQIIEKQLDESNQEYNEQSEKLKEKKEQTRQDIKDDEDKAFELKKQDIYNHQRDVERNKGASMFLISLMNNNFIKILSSLYKILSDILQSLWKIFIFLIGNLKWLFEKIYTFAKDGLSGLFSRIKEFVNWLTNVIGAIIVELRQYSKHPIVVIIISAIVGLLVLVFIILIIIWIIKYGLGFMDIPELPKIPSKIDFNLGFLTDMMNNIKISENISSNFNYIKEIYKPFYTSLPTAPNISFSDFLSNPFTSISLYFAFFNNSFYTSFYNSSFATNTSYSYNFIKTELPKTLNISATVDNKIKRELYNEGRNDDFIYINANLIANKKLLKDKNLPESDSIINISRPKDIIWEMPVIDYVAKDINKLPPSLLNKALEDGTSLNDKKRVVIPWLYKNNYYQLSCGDAYFEKNKEKANILIDNVDDKKTCVFDTNTNATEYNQIKKRYDRTDDLSNYL